MIPMCGTHCSPIFYSRHRRFRLPSRAQPTSRGSIPRSPVRASTPIEVEERDPRVWPIALFPKSAAMHSHLVHSDQDWLAKKHGMVIIDWIRALQDRSDGSSDALTLGTFGSRLAGQEAWDGDY